ncbi:YkgJ family cysteine cluster protein [Desulfarculales bacterium]
MAYPAHTLRQLLEELEALRARADASFQKVAELHPQAVACHEGCDDCCHALFDLSPMEAISLALAFLDLPRATRREARRRGKKAADLFNQTMSRAFSLQGQERLKKLSLTRVLCPLLEGGHCLLYRERPLTCRLYGVPVQVEKQARVCHLARFNPGQTYPTVDLLRVQMELERLSDLAASLLPSLNPARRDMARALELAYSHGPALRTLLK